MREVYEWYERRGSGEETQTSNKEGKKRKEEKKETWKTGKTEKSMNTFSKDALMLSMKCSL